MKLRCDHQFFGLKFAIAKKFLLTQMRFRIGEKRITCHGSKLTNSLGKLNNNCSLKLWQIYEPASVKQTVFS